MTAFDRERLKRAMTERGIDSAQLARSACLAHSTVWRLLRGERKEVQLRTLASIARALNVDVSWLSGKPIAKQLAFWPAPLESDVISPELLIARVLRGLSHDVRTQATRAALAAVIEVMTQSGRTPDASVYSSLLALDAARAARLADAKAPRRRKVG